MRNLTLITRQSSIISRFSRFITSQFSVADMPTYGASFCLAFNKFPNHVAAPKNELH